MASSDVNINVEIESKDAVKSLSKLSKSTKKFGDDSSKAFKKASTSFDVFKGVLTANIVTSAVKSFSTAVIGMGSASIKAAADLETVETGFTTLLGSTEKAKEAVKDLQEFTAKTPFRFEGVSKSAQQLLAFGIQADDVIPKLKQIGDVAAGSNSSLTEVATIFGQVRAAGKLTGERLLQFQERAVPLGPAIAKTMGVAEESIRDLVSKGKVGFAEFEAAFASLSEQDGLFFGATIKQSKTFNGAISTLQDNIQILAANMGQELLPNIKDLAITMTEFVQNNQVPFVNFFKSVVTYSGEMIEGIKGVQEIFKQDQYEKKIEELKKFDAQMTYTTGRIHELKQVIKGREGDDEESFFARAKNFLGRKPIKVLNDELEKAQEKYRNMLDMRKKIIEGDKGDEQKDVDDNNIAKIKANKDKEQAVTLDAEKKKYDLLSILKQEFDLKQEEYELNKRIAKDENDVVAIEKLKENLQLQADIKKQYHAEDTEIAVKYNNIRLASTKKAANEAQKARGDAAKKARKEEETSLKSLFNFEKNTNAGRAANFRSTLGTISTLQQSSNKTAFAIGKAAAIANATIDGIAAVQKALASAPPPFNFALAGVVGAATAINIGKIASAKPPAFADGGVVGGIGGATAGVDNRIIQAKEGEMFLNAEQQKSLYDSIRGGSSNGNNAPIIIQIDGREIARAVKEQINQGFQLA